jgi:hypothetical protein
MGNATHAKLAPIKTHPGKLLAQTARPEASPTQPDYLCAKIALPEVRVWQARPVASHALTDTKRRVVPPPASLASREKLQMPLTPHATSAI